MNPTLANSAKYAAEHRFDRFDFRSSIADQPCNLHRKPIDMLQTPTIHQFHLDWFGLRVWEDDGGGQAQLS